MPKNIIICCDGTGNEYGQHNTNVVKLYEAIVRDANQIAFYDPGVAPSAFSAENSAAVWGSCWGRRSALECSRTSRTRIGT